MTALDPAGQDTRPLNAGASRRVELILPMRTVLLIAATAGVLLAFWAIGDTFLIVFVGIFLALVFEAPVRYLMAKTTMSRGVAAAVAVLGTALAVTVLALLFLVPLVGGVRDFLQGLPATVEQLRESDELSSLAESGAAENVQAGAEKVSASVPDAISSVLGIAGGFVSGFLVCFTIIFVCMFLLSDIANMKRALGSVLVPGEDERWLGVWERVTTSISRWAIGVVVIAAIAGTTQGLTAWLLGSSYAVGLAVIAGLLDMIPNLGATLAGVILVPALWAEEGTDRRTDHARRAARLPAGREQRPDAEDPGQGGQPLGLLHHRVRHALRLAARRPRRAHRGPARGDDPDLRPGADDGPPGGDRDSPRGAGSTGARSSRGAGELTLRAGRPREAREAMSESEDPALDPALDGDGAPDADRGNRARRIQDAMAGASERHVALSVPLRAAERNRRVAASVLAGGFAYRLFLWLLPFGLILGGALGLANADDTEDAVERGGLPGAVTNAIGDAARATESESWWLFAVGVPLLLWAGFTGAKAVQLIHSLVWDEPPPKPRPLTASLAFTGMVCAFIASVGLTWWVRDDWPGLLAPVITFAPLAGLWLWVSLHLPHRDAPWTALLPGALVVAIGFQVLHEVVGALLVPKLEKSTSLYGDLGATTTFLFFMYMISTLVVMAPVLNSSLYDELGRRRASDDEDAAPTRAATPA